MIIGFPSGDDSAPARKGVKLLRHSILETSELLRKGAVSPVELTNDCLKRIEKLNPSLNAFITVTAEMALEEARQAESEIRGGNWRGPLHGIPLALKDLIDTAGIRTTAASALFKDRIPTEDADVVRRLKDAGAVILGKQNLHEFAYGGSSLVSYYGDMKNARNPEQITGGSSGGSATAVEAGMCYGAIVTDTACSIREPAALCGVVGLKPNYGRISTRGVIPLSVSLDHVGPIARSVEDCAVILQAIADGSSNGIENYIEAIKQAPGSLRIGVPRTFFYESLDPQVSSAVENALEVLKTVASEVRDIEMSVPTDRTLQKAESYAYHAEFVKRSPELYQPETLRRIRKGEEIDAAEIVHARRELEQARREIRNIFEKVDVLVTPTTPIPAPRIAELKENPEALRPRELELLRNTRPFNVWGLPAISVPCGFTQAGLPIGLQIASPHWREDLVLALAHWYDQTAVGVRS
jgi:aspartyl-tRNA(Asn)/glutamyl-tRNA(Gln) amidotransferase subunit A